MNAPLPSVDRLRRAYHATWPNPDPQAGALNFWAVSAAQLAGDRKLGSGVVYAMWPPLHIISEIWEAGGLGARDRAFMADVDLPKAAILARSGQARGGAAFVAIDKDIAMVHAINVALDQRQNGVAKRLLKTAACWASDHGAPILALAVNPDNIAANALFAKLGMDLRGQYDYLLTPKG